MAAGSCWRWAPTRGPPEPAPLRVPQFPWMPSWVPWGGFWTSSHPGPKVVGVPVPVACNMNALRHQLPGRTPWVGVWQGPPGPSLPPGAGAGPGRASPGCCPPPEPPRRRWDPVGPVQRLGVGGWGHSPALALGPFQACGNRLGGAPVYPPSLTLRTGPEARLESVQGQVADR